MKKVDIVIPIYNAIDDLKLCLESIYKNTDLKIHRLILINDKSPDERIKPFLDSQERENVIVIHNEVNKGFSNNINIGMAQSDERDVILLNSDTVVTSNWVEKMLVCAYSSEEIGTVTPLSNNATLCSVPALYEENELPDGMTIEQMADIVEKASLKKYPRITVANGFCMLVKRTVIQAIGNFDAETFGRGYGEENDFCNRAEQMGFIHVMCDDTYIYHSGTKSFLSKEKEEYIRQHDKILHERYPEQMRKNHMHFVNNPNRWVGQNIAFHMDLLNGKKNVLYLLQSDFRDGADDNVGGTQLHVKHLTQMLQNDMNIIVAARNREYLQVTAYIENEEYLFRFYIGPAETFPLLRNRRMDEVFKCILGGFHIDLVHVHHTATTSLDIYFAAQKLGIPVIYTAHDFYYVCPSVKMLDIGGKVCIGKENLDCAKCLRIKGALYERNQYLKMWREQHGKVLDICQQIVVPSESTKEILSLYYPEQKEKIRVIPHGMDAPKLLMIDENKFIFNHDLKWRIEHVNKNGMCILVAGAAYLKGEEQQKYKIILRLKDGNGKVIYLPTNFGQNFDLAVSENRFFAYIPNSILADGDIELRVVLVKEGQYYIRETKKAVIEDCKFKDNNKFKIAFIGGISEEKGGKIIANLIKQGTDDVEWYVFGGIGEESLYQLKRENLVKTSYYHQEDLYTLLTYHKIDAICILSKWPETFSYTLSEAVLSQLPVIVTNIGALGQRTQKEGFGATVSVDEENAVVETLKIIESWKNKDTNYQHVLSKQREYQHPSLLEMSNDYSGFYSEICETCEIREKGYSAEVNIKLWDARIANEEKGRNESELLNRISELENRLKIIDKSVTFKIALKLASMNIPFKKQLKRILTKN